jgi:hypothetical protein
MGAVRRPTVSWCCSTPREVTTTKSTLGVVDQKNARILSPDLFSACEKPPPPDPPPPPLPFAVDKGLYITPC